MKKFSYSLISIVLILLINTFILFYYFWTYDYSHYKVRKYEKNENMVDFYEKYNEELEKISEFIITNNVSSIKYSYSQFCPDNKEKINISKDIYACGIQKDISINDYSKIREYIEELVYKGKIREIISIQDENDKVKRIDFYLMNSLNGYIKLSYCKKEICELKAESYETKKGKYSSNQISDEWFSIYNTIPSI